jgi:hypothetical protein
LILPVLLLLAFYFLIPLRQHRLALPVAALAAPSALLLLTLRRLAPGAWRPILSLATGWCLVLAVLLQVAIGLIRLAQLYGGVFDIGVNMSEFSRATVLYAGKAPLATMSFAGAFFLIACVLACALRAPRPGGRGTLLGAAAAAILTVMFAVEQSRTPYSGEGLARVYNWFAGPDKHAAAPDCNPGQSRGPGSTGIVGIHAVLPLRGPRLQSPVRLLLNRPRGDRPLHERAETLQFDPQTRGWTAIGTLADRDIFEANLDRYRIDHLVIASAIGTRGLWPAEYEWVRGRPDAWNCPAIFSNAISGDPGARIAVCRRTNLCGLRGAWPQ